MGASAEEIELVYRDRYVGFRNALATVSGSQDTARDAVQEGFARALASRAQFRGGSLEAWIWRIALRCGLEAGRSRARFVVNGSLGALDPQLLEPERDPELAAAVRALPPRRRLMIFLRYFADLSYTEIAEACEVAEGTVAATLAQAHAGLAVQLDAEGERR